jgi:hypothetical protein
VTSVAANRARERYFDPSEDTERKFVGLGHRVRTRFESLGECADERHQDDTNRGSSIRVSGQIFSLAGANEKISNPTLDTTLSMYCTLKWLTVSQGPISKWIQ